MNETIGSRIVKYRKEKGLTQEELANKLGVSSQAVSKWENDASCPDITLLPQLCKELGVTADELLTGKSDKVIMLPEAERKSLDELTLRVRVDSSDGDRLRVNLPMTLVKISMEMGVEVTPNINGSDAMRKMDWNRIVDLAERGMIGKIVEMESAEGDIVEVVVE